MLPADSLAQQQQSQWLKAHHVQAPAAYPPSQSVWRTSDCASAMMSQSCLCCSGVLLAHTHEHLINSRILPIGPATMKSGNGTLFDIQKHLLFNALLIRSRPCSSKGLSAVGAAAAAPVHGLYTATASTSVVANKFIIFIIIGMRQPRSRSLHVHQQFPAQHFGVCMDEH